VKYPTLYSIEVSKFEISKILASVLAVSAQGQINLKSLAARNKICSMFLAELTRLEESKSAE